MKRYLPLLVLLGCSQENAGPPREAYIVPEPATRRDEAAQAPSGRPAQEPTGLEQPAPTAPAPGARLSLSNDDSMSLASAQRVLWAVAEGERVSANELRPHELLNYFNFEAPPVEPGAVFGVSASAVRSGGEFSLALTVTSPARARDPLDLTVVVDRSGSMKEDGRIDYVKRGLVRMTERLQRGDRVNVIYFDDDALLVKQGFEVGKDDLDDLCLVFEQLEPGGATDLDEALALAYRTARDNPKRGHDGRVLLITDARITAGELSTDRVTEIGKAFDESGIRLAAIGVGRDFDDEVLQELTEKGHGAYVYLGSEKVVDRVFGSGFDALVDVVAEDVRFDLTLPPSLAMKRFYGEEMSTSRGEVDPVSFHAGNTQVFLQDLDATSADARDDRIVLDISWRDPDTHKARSQRWQGRIADALGDRSNVDKARALMAWTDLVRVGSHGCYAEKEVWASRLRQFGGDTETRYLDGLVDGWCPEPPSSQSIAEAG